MIAIVREAAFAPTTLRIQAARFGCRQTLTVTTFLDAAMSLFEARRTWGAHD
jgi:hypothetical protein